MCDSWKGHEIYEYNFVAIFNFLIPVKTKGHIYWHVMDKHGKKDYNFEKIKKRAHEIYLANFSS